MIRGTAPGAGLSVPRVMQQGQRDGEEEELGASAKKKTSGGVGNLGGKWVKKGRCEGYLDRAPAEGSSLEQSEEGQQALEGREGGAAGPGRAGTGAGVGSAEGRSRGRGRGWTCKGGRADPPGGVGTEGGGSRPGDP